MENKNNYKEYHTGKTQRKPDNSITLDSNMVGYLYVLSSKNLTAKEYSKIKRNLNAEQYRIVMHIIDSNFQGIDFHTTPQVIKEVCACAKLKGDYGIVDFLSKLCKINIPKTSTDKVKFAELIVDLMDEYLVRDIPLSTTAREYQSAVATEIKNGEVDYSDAKIVAENNILNGCPLITRNEKHLVSMDIVNLRNSLRSTAILAKNKKFLKSRKYVISNKKVRKNLNSKRSTTFRISEVPKLIDM